MSLLDESAFVKNEKAKKASDMISGIIAYQYPLSNRK